jgi:hypothetical protein
MDRNPLANNDAISASQAWLAALSDERPPPAS